MTFHITPFLLWKFEIHLGEECHSVCFCGLFPAHGMVCSGLSCLFGWHFFRIPACPFPFRAVPCAIVEGGWTEAAWTHKAGALGQGTPGASSLRAARTCSCAFCCLFLYVDFVLGVVSHSSKRVSYILCMLKAADPPPPLGKQTQLLLHLPFQTEVIGLSQNPAGSHRGPLWLLAPDWLPAWRELLERLRVLEVRPGGQVLKNPGHFLIL